VPLNFLFYTFLHSSKQRIEQFLHFSSACIVFTATEIAVLVRLKKFSCPTMSAMPDLSMTLKTEYLTLAKSIFMPFFSASCNKLSSAWIPVASIILTYSRRIIIIFPVFFS